MNLKEYPSKILKRNIVLCICGMAGSGKSTLARKIAEHYGFKYYSGGDALKALAAEMGYKTYDQGWWESEEGIKFLRERMNTPDLDRKVDEKLMEWAKEGEVVLDSWTMPWLLKDGFKVWLEASEEARAKRIAERDNLRLEETIRFIREKESRTRAIFKKLYGFSLGEDFEPFHAIIDVEILDKEEAFHVLCMVIDNLILKDSKRCSIYTSL